MTARRFCLVSADHPLGTKLPLGLRLRKIIDITIPLCAVSAISENAERLQMGDISMMPEGLVKISSSLYETILPMVCC